MTRMLLVATYELGHQPVNLARPAALLTAAGHEVRTVDTSVEPWDPELAEWADAVAVSVPMHTATRLARDLLATLDDGIPTCCYGLYAHLCADVADRVIAGEYEAALLSWASGATPDPLVGDVARPRPHPFPLPRRELLPPLSRYAHLLGGTRGGADAVGIRLAASVETTRGCAHRCRHCPVPVVYDGRVRVQDEAAVLADVDQLVATGAAHLTFADPDFLNAPRHALRIVRSVHAAHPRVTFDVTVKVEHVLRHRDVWPELAGAGCLFVVSAFESVDDVTLARLDKGHTTADAAAAVEVLQVHGIDVRPSFLPFTPWTTREQLVDLLDFVHAHDLVDRVDPVQYTIRLLLPPGSLLLDHADLAPHLLPYDAEALTYRWRSADPAMDDLQGELAALVEELAGRDAPIPETYSEVRRVVGAPPVDLGTVTTGSPRLSESWFCCAEPTGVQRSAFAAS